ncbi:MAG: DUF3307 domain-containing protein [Clostridiales bacterium]|nr:DUF3307 domain-containing protein [Clostridiales bacterium]
MIRNVFLYLIMLHIIGDYYLQNESLANDKKEDIKKLFVHAGTYFVGSVILILPVWSSKIFLCITISSLLHLVIDFIKFFVTKLVDKIKITETDNSNDLSKAHRFLYIIDQLVHVISIYVLSYYYVENGNTIRALKIFYNNKISMDNFLSFAIMILLVLKPVNITFRILFSHIKPHETNENDEEEYQAGKLIGSIERLLASVLLLVNQYIAIGLIFTAKSITRYDKISEDQKFAEYYLLGTLFSMLSTIVIYLTLFKL